MKPLDTTVPAPEAGLGTGKLLERELAWFFGYSNDLLAILDERGVALALSPSFRRLLGYDVGEITGRHMLRLVDPAHRKLVKASVRGLSLQNRVVAGAR